MRRIVFLFPLLLTGFFIKAQAPDTKLQLTKEAYLKKSRNQKKAARILITGGSIIAVTGLGLAAGNLNGLFDPNAPDNGGNGNAADILGYSGLALMASGIPLFIAASGNKKKAMSISFERQKIPGIHNGSFTYRAVPSLRITLGL